MSLPLLSTKFNIPAAGIKTIQRPRLTHILDESLKKNAALILVCGPAGYGKTTVVSEWLQTSLKEKSVPHAWLTLERMDDDLIRFLTYLIKALQRTHPGFGDGVLNMLQTHRPPAISALATLLINEMSEISERFFLILDDYHLLSAESIHTFIAFLVDHQPRQMCLVLITRTDPALPLARLRARGQLIELRQDALRFQPEEVAEFIRETMDLGLTPQQIAFLGKKTEGWISGLQLAVISLRNMQDSSDFFQAFSGEHEFIADYLTEEVLSLLPESVRTFLLETSILEQLSASLCDAVTGQSGAQATLDYLTEANLFITPLDSQHTWYRYHTLFADLLRKRLQSARGESVNTLHNRASQWLEEHGLVDQAIEHAIKGKKYKRAAILIEQIAENLLRYGETRTLLRWLEALPEEEVFSRPRLGSIYGFTLVMSGRSAQVLTKLLEKMAESNTSGDMQGEMLMLKALAAILQGETKRTIDLSEQALQHLQPEQSFFRSLVDDTLGMGYTLAGDIPAATRAFEQVVEIARQSDNLMMEIAALTNMAGLQYVHGELGSALFTCQEVVDLAKSRLGPNSPFIGKTLVNLGEILREQGDYEAAETYFVDGARLMENYIEIGLPLAYLSIARLKMDQMDWPASQSYIDQARQLAKATKSTQMDDRLVELAQVRLWIMHGEIEKAAQWIHAQGLLERSIDESLQAAQRNAALNELFQAEMLILARFLLAQKQPERVIEVAARLSETNQKRGNKRRQAEFLVLKALAHHQMNMPDAALDELRKALQLGEPEKYQSLFVEHIQPMAQLLYMAVERKIFPEYSGKLLSIITSQHPAPSVKEKPNGELIEPLSEREIEVLQLIAEGLSNSEIARRLYISLSTVKGHTTNIYAKLGVSKRTQAVVQARSLGILEIE